MPLSGAVSTLERITSQLVAAEWPPSPPASAEGRRGDDLERGWDPCVSR